MALTDISRRMLVTGAAAASISTPSWARSDVSFDFSKPRDNLTAYLKLQSSLANEDVWQWFTGKLDLAVPGQEIVPLIAYDSLVRRRSEKIDDGIYHVTSWEATFYKDLETGEFADELFNPLAERMIRPYHYREGPTKFLFSENQPRLLTGRDVLPKDGKPFLLPWTVAGNDVWVSRENFIKAPHPMDKEVWTLEAAGDDLITSSHSTHKGLRSDLVDPRLQKAPAEFIYQATSIWLPFMLMGQQPGWVIWRAFGRKLDDPAQIPQASLEVLESVHADIFAAGTPWEDFSLMFFDYQKDRQPAD